MTIPVQCIMKLKVEIMDKEKLIYYFENSFLSSLLLDKDVTDISYNGEDFYYVSNISGRQKSDIKVDPQMVKDFIRQIANLTEQQFSYSSPILDSSFGKYRIHATHQSIGKIDDEDAITFSIRIASITPKITDDSDFFSPLIVELITYILSNRLSIVIGGITGSGKTEFQKYLLRKMPANERVIVIDNVMELDQIRKNTDIDLTCWKADERNINTSASSLIRNALRNNPDWLILAEARGKEMIDVLNSAMTGAPIITTIHSLDAQALPSRMARLIQRNEQKMDYEEILTDIYYHFHFYFYLKKAYKNHQIKRYISEIIYIDSAGKYTSIYRKTKDKTSYKRLPKEAVSLLEIEESTLDFNRAFLGGRKYE